MAPVIDHRANNTKNCPQKELELAGSVWYTHPALCDAAPT
jgi:hypothetical protein